MWSARASAAGLALLVLSGCGFRPLYAEHSPGGGIAAELAQVAVGRIPERSGQLLRQFLTEELAPDGPRKPAHDLLIQLTETFVGTAISKDATATRTNISFTASFRLVDRTDSKLRLEGRERAVASYDSVASEYATEVARRDARRRSIEVLGTRIVRRLVLHFRRNGSRS